MKATKLLILSLITAILTACAGGGSAGTGTGLGLTIEGVVLDLQSKPVEGALVTVQETGDSDISDANGNFSISTTTVADQLTLSIESQGKTNYVTINADEGDSALQITVKFNPLIEETEASELKVNSKIVGECERNFSNKRVINQERRFQGPLTCTVKTRVEGDGVLLAHVPIAIQFRACRMNSPWATIALGATMTGVNLGIGQVPFTFVDDEKHCVYRVLAPFNSEKLAPVVYEIHTLTYQKFLER